MWSCEGCPSVLWNWSAGFCQLFPAILVCRKLTVNLPALVPSPGHVGEKPSVNLAWEQIHLLFCKNRSVSYSYHRSICLHHLERRGWSFFGVIWKALGRLWFQVMGKQVSILTVFTALWLCKLHTGPLVPAVKVKRHEIKSDPTPLGFEGMSISILHENLFSSFLYHSLNSHLITASGWHWSPCRQ